MNMRQILTEKGYEIVENIYSVKEVNEILELLKSIGVERKFGVREFLSNHPDVREKIFSKKLIDVIKSISPNCNQSVKSIFFDKPPHTNWVVNWHQDLTINLSNKRETPSFKNWRVNEERTVVQPNKEFLESIFTIRIHLDDCTKENGALRVIEKSHSHGVIAIKEWMKHKEGMEKICEVKKGGILIMKPLILHSSKRTENQRNRRVIHIEFTDLKLPTGLHWKENIAFGENASLQQ